MKIRVDDVKEIRRSLDFQEDVRALNELLSESKPVDYQLAKPVDVHMSHYRCGEDLVFDGRLSTTVSGTCARCLETYPFPIECDFSFVAKPAPAAGAPPAASDEDRALSFYSGDEIDLSPLLREELLLSLPTRPLCREDCSGLCPRCGKNRNTGSCSCTDDWVDPRLAPLRELKLRS